MKKQFLEWNYGEFVIIPVDALHHRQSASEVNMFEVHTTVLLGEIARITRDVDPLAAVTFKKVKSQLEKEKFNSKVTLAVSLVGAVVSVGFGVVGIVGVVGAGAAAAVAGAGSAAVTVADDAAIAVVQVATKVPATAVVNFVTSGVSAVATAGAAVYSSIQGKTEKQDVDGNESSLEFSTETSHDNVVIYFSKYRTRYKYTLQM